VRAEVGKSARILTDEYIGYRGLGDEFEGGHETVTHLEREYARGDVFTNTAESFVALLKRGVLGTYHAVSRKHLHRFLDSEAEDKGPIHSRCASKTPSAESVGPTAFLGGQRASHGSNSSTISPMIGPQ
jgi:hypothetical protein